MPNIHFLNGVPEVLDLFSDGRSNLPEPQLVLFLSSGLLHLFLLMVASNAATQLKEGKQIKTRKNQYYCIHADTQLHGLLWCYLHHV